MAEWLTAKTDWNPTDRFNVEDYNRIKNNLLFLKEQAAKIWGNFQITDMGEDITEDTDYWDVDVFNAFESNIDTINEHMLSQNYGIEQTFYENGPFVKYDELNRIENAILRMKRIVDGRKASVERLAFRFGGPRQFKI